MSARRTAIAGVAQRRVHAVADLGQHEARLRRDVVDPHGRQGFLEIAAPRGDLRRRVVSTRRRPRRWRRRPSRRSPCSRPTTAPGRARSSATSAGVAEHVAGPDAGDAPVLGQAADDQQPRVAVPGQGRGLAGHGVHERLVDDDQPARSQQRRDRRGAGAGRRSGWSGCRSRPGRRRRARRPGRARTARGSTTSVTACPACSERGVRLGELRVHDDRAPPRPQPGDQRERLGGAGGRQHLVGRRGRAGAAIAASAAVGGRVAADVVEARAQRGVEPGAAAARRTR